MEWIKQQITKKLIASLITHSVILSFSYLLSCLIALIKIHSIIPVYETTMLAVSYQSHLTSKHSSIITSSCYSIVQSNKNHPQDNGTMYYSIVTNSKYTVSPGFQYYIDIHAVECTRDIQANCKWYRDGLLNIKLRSETGALIVDKHENFSIKVLNQTIISTKSEEVNEICFELSSKLLSGGKLLAPISDGCIKLDSPDKNVISIFSKRYLYVYFNLNCKQDLFTRLLCFRPSKWILIIYMWIALSTSLMIIISASLVATKVIRFFVINASTTLLMKLGDYVTITRVLENMLHSLPKGIMANNNGPKDQRQHVELTNDVIQKDKLITNNNQTKYDDQFDQLIKAIEMATISGSGNKDLSLPESKSGLFNNQTGKVTKQEFVENIKDDKVTNQLCSNFTLQTNDISLNQELASTSNHMINILNYLLDKARNYTYEAIEINSDTDLLEKYKKTNDKEDTNCRDLKVSPMECNISNETDVYSLNYFDHTCENATKHLNNVIILLKEQLHNVQN